MKLKLERVLTLIMGLMLMLSVIPINAAVPNEPHAANALWIEPSSIDGGAVGLHGKFNVTVWVNLTVPSYTWQVKMLFNTTQLRAIRAGYTAGPVSDFFQGLTTVPVTPVIDNTAGFVLHGESLMGAIQRDPGYGSLFWVEFEVIKAPGKRETLTSELDITTTYPDDTYVLDPDLNPISLTPYNAHYEWVWVQPPLPHLAVRPEEVSFGPEPPSAVGKIFSVNIYIENLDATWGLTNASLHLRFDNSLIEFVDIAFDPLWGTTSYTYAPGDLYMVVKDPSATPSGNVLIATVSFNVTFQDTAPPRTLGEYDETPLDISDYKLFDHVAEIPTEPEIDGSVKIYAMMVLKPPYLQVSNVTLGPEYSIGKRFNVTVDLKRLAAQWYLTGVQFRLSYDPEWIEVVQVYEGAFLKSFANLQPGSLGTFFQCYVENNTVYGPHILIGVMIYPNATGMWNPPWPEGNGTIAIIEFECKKQEMAPPLSHEVPLNIIEQLAVGIDDPTVQNIVEISLATPINGTCTIYNQLPGRQIDLYGGAVNGGYGKVPFPAPYGGQGPNQPMDLVIPQSEVTLFANVTYNLWPVRNKRVTFTVKDPYGNVRFTLVSLTNDSGIAKVTFRMPWPAEDPENLFGVWNVIATVSVADESINDTLSFHYDYLVHIWKVSTDKYAYKHYDEVSITIEFGTHAIQQYPVLVTAVILDELGVPIGYVYYNTTVGGAVFCCYKDYSITLTIKIPKSAFAGTATIHVNCFDKDPWIGGTAWCPEYTPPPKIYIIPE